MVIKIEKKQHKSIAYYISIAKLRSPKPVCALEHIPGAVGRVVTAKITSPITIKVARYGFRARIAECRAVKSFCALEYVPVAATGTIYSQITFSVPIKIILHFP